MPSSSVDSLRLSVLNEIALALSGELDRRRLFEGIVHGARRLLGTPTAVVWSWHPERGDLVPEAATFTDPVAPTAAPGQLPVCVGPAVLQKRTVTIDDLSGHPQTPGFVRAMNLGAAAATPLLRMGEPLGVIVVAHAQGAGTLTAADVRLLEILAGHVALALANAETVAHAVRRAAGAEELSLALHGIIEAHDREVILQRALDCATGVLAADRAAIYLGDEQENLVFAAARRLSTSYLEQVANAYRRSVGAIFVLARSPIYVADMSTDPRTRVLHSAAAQEGLRSLLVVPLVHRERLLGGLALYHDLVWRYEVGEIDAARALADQLALALGNAYLFEQTQRQLAQLRALAAVTRALGEPGSDDERAYRGAQALISSGGASGAWVWRRGPGDGLRLAARAGFSPVSDGDVADAARAALSADHDPVSRSAGGDVLVAARLVYSGETLGALVLMLPMAHAPQARLPTVFVDFGADDGAGERDELARTAAALIASALGQAELHARAQSTAEWFASVLGGVPEALVVFDPGGRVVFHNRKLLEVFGLAGDLVGWSAEAFSRAIDGGRPGLRRTSGPVLGPGGEVLGEVVVYQVALAAAEENAGLQ